ncbi:glycogen operon protein [Tistlia consotensis]|uniref:Glycogen operon protein n=1 Tax=Tistlia consotensis USBA 355 TaxID=560819 RepID=A0A1Y6BUG0_9PROT|nr:glycogen operon protein [Tistlia consotensis USBA 355]SNR65809.1 glycogen operon protein [Tistlia consotensis]
MRDCCDGFNFAVFSRHAEAMQLLLFRHPGSHEPWCVIDLDPARHRTGDVWHALVDGIGWRQAYAYRVFGPWAPTQGHRFDRDVELLDPYALATTAAANWDFRGDATIDRQTDPAPGAASPASPAASPPRSLLVSRRFDWQGVGRPKRPWSETIVYETHVRGLTIHASSGARHPGTFLAVIDKIPHFRRLGVTAVELMPVQEFDARDNPRTSPSGHRLSNYWGYATTAFFAPKAAYGTARDAGCEVEEFKTMVRELHRAGIEVIMDVVFNHTGEGGEAGPTLSFRGFDNAIYYMLDEAGRYRNLTGCGNTFNCNHPVVRDYVVDCLRYWATEMQVDGFRFDLASILGRGEHGELLHDPPLLERIAEDPILRDVKLIAEAWDAAGAFQVGSFPAQRWAEWNSRYRDDVRRFWRGDPGLRGALAWRVCGSADLYQKAGKEPVGSVNFVTCHDGFTLADLTSYAHKRNEANGEANRDGPAEEFSAGYGAEGDTGDPEVRRIRLRQAKNLLATLFVSRGVPMLLGGDEFGRSQGGNSNAYCQDNAVSWYDWRLVERNGEIFRFARAMAGVRRRFATLRSDAFYSEDEVRWFDCDGQPPDWQAPHGTLGMLIRSGESANDDRPLLLCILFNAGEAPVGFVLPPSPEPWRVVFDTAKAPPEDIRASGEEPCLPRQSRYGLEGRSMAMVVSGRARS